MPRRAKVQHRPVLPDPKYNNKNVTRLVGRLMWDGKRSLAERIVYQALTLVEERSKRSPIEVYEQALRAATPMIEVKLAGAVVRVAPGFEDDAQLTVVLRAVRASASRG